MERTDEIALPLVVLVSLFMHLTLLLGLMMPDYRALVERKKTAGRLFGGRDIIVNVNEDGRKDYRKETLLSEKDSSARGFITRERGDHWLNNSLEFKVKRGKARLGRQSSASSSSREPSALLISENTELIISLMKIDEGGLLGEEGGEDFTTIPDRNSFTRRNAIFYSNDGRFSFNTAKFKNFRYFKAMKERIASHWFPPLMANAIIGGYNPMTSAYTPGRLRIMAIPSQEVRLYFTMNRRGEVLEVVIVDSLGNVSLDSSCVDAIRHSREFGAVPEDITGKVIIIPFVFGYYVY